MTSRRSRTDIHDLPKLKGFRRALRKRLTPAEASFWNMVKNGRLDGRKFRRQHSVGNYIFDFYCPSEKLAIELDGQGHFVGHPKLNDRSKRLFAESCGLRVLRFENKMLLADEEWVLAVIRSHFGWWMIDASKLPVEQADDHLENHPVSPKTADTPPS